MTKPEGWSVKKLGEMGKFVSGGTPDTEKPEYWNGDIIWLTPSEITKLPTRFVSDSERKITVAGLKNSSAVLLPVGSLIVCTRATVGDCCINTTAVSTNQGFKNLIPENSNIDFLYYLVSSHKTDLIRKACGSTFLEISKHDIEKLKYPVPPLPEQEKIAEILGCWDDGIEKLSRLIEQKKQLKKGLMQRLLTGKQRLPGFSDPWSVKKLGDIGKVSMCKRIMKHETNSIAGIPFYKIGTFGGKADAYISEKLYLEYRHKFAYPKKGDILISAAGTIGRTVVFNGEDAYFQDSNIVWLANDETKALNKYLLFYYTTNPWYTTTGGAISRLYNENITNAKIILPPLAEQEKIADILSKADEEITLLTEKLSALKTQKTGLMQKLLT
ncbi:MAG: restriction endonuclease subunit S, partial [Alphaproteobacteria bacterium]|nr:restriction endonuclease subunit S [Alphaproteobacteria bacterium]